MDVASYAAVPHIVRIAKSAEKRDWNVYGLVGVIEAERHRKANPPIPSWLRHDYEAALQEIVALALQDLTGALDSLTLQSALSMLALVRGNRKLGTLLFHHDSADIDELAEGNCFGQGCTANKVLHATFEDARA
ncbi:hypothetical protein JM946_00145 [Steroidobacter sp. S1-65]|uniref:Uncharacterized protein n=1 Tax=Steroidobacter gossypii TaxID=2805490 RepID=A0ABS1WQ74_9GAMM|nr:hypothetical protein [Steroidobacter gossypii]MBM0103129.1 hypothetical protein [Steroidobacter gossypii]